MVSPISRCAAAAFALGALGASADDLTPAFDADVPVAPIAASAYAGWPAAFSLKNAACEAVVVPSIGRIVAVIPTDGSNLLHLATALAGRDPAMPELRDRWANFGGAWFWPVAQSHWATLQKAGSNPARLLDGRAWEGRAWKAADGSRVCRLTIEFGPPLNCRAIRTVRVGRFGATVRIQQRIERTGPSEIPVALWSVAQVASPLRVILPGTPPLRTVAFAAPPAGSDVAASGARVYHVELGGEHRLASDAPAHWIAADLGRHLVIQRMESSTNAAPDAATAIAYVHRGSPYGEIELTGKDHALAPGAAIENTIRLDIHPSFTGMSDERLAERVRMLAEDDPSAVRGAAH